MEEQGPGKNLKYVQAVMQIIYDCNTVRENRRKIEERLKPTRALFGDETYENLNIERPKEGNAVAVDDELTI